MIDIDLDLTHVPYRIWLKRDEQVASRKKLEADAGIDDALKCDLCGGTGEHRCECGDEHDCGQCGGTGISSDLEAELDHIFTRMYSAQCKEDEMMLFIWVNGFPMKAPRREL